MCLAGGYYLSQMRTAAQHGGIPFSSRRLCWLSAKSQLVRDNDWLPFAARDSAQPLLSICCCRAYSQPKCALLYFSPWDNICVLHTCARMNRACTGFGEEGKAACSLPLSQSRGPGLTPLSGWLQHNNDLIHRGRCAAEVIPGHMGLGAKPPHSRHD